MRHLRDARDLRYLVCGDSGLLIETDEPSTVVALYHAARREPPPAVVDLVPARRTLLLKLAPQADLDAIRRHIDGLELRETVAIDSPVVEIPVSYNGPDLASVGELTGLTRSEIVDLHTEGVWTVAFCGFAPGFSYLIGGNPRLSVPRLETPRVRVPAGSVGLAGEFTGVYPRESPGGWRLIGVTDLVLWDIERDPPGVLTSGMRVRFRPA